MHSLRVTGIESRMLWWKECNTVFEPHGTVQSGISKSVNYFSLFTMKFQINKFINDRNAWRNTNGNFSNFLSLVTPVYHHFSILEQTEARQVEMKHKWSKMKKYIKIMEILVNNFIYSLLLCLKIIPRFSWKLQVLYLFISLSFNIREDVPRVHERKERQEFQRIHRALKFSWFHVMSRYILLHYIMYITYTRKHKVANLPNAETWRHFSPCAPLPKFVPHLVTWIKGRKKMEEVRWISRSGRKLLEVS